jgi:hypothetical protein
MSTPVAGERDQATGPSLEGVALLVDLWIHENEILNMKLVALGAIQSFLGFLYASPARGAWLAWVGIVLCPVVLDSLMRTAAYRKRWRTQVERAHVAGVDLTRLKAGWHLPSAFAAYAMPVVIAICWIVVLARG